MSDDDLRLALSRLDKDGLAVLRTLILFAIDGDGEEAAHYACLLDRFIGAAHHRRVRNGRR